MNAILRKLSVRARRGVTVLLARARCKYYLIFTTSERFGAECECTAYDDDGTVIGVWAVNRVAWQRSKYRMGDPVFRSLRVATNIFYIDESLKRLANEMKTPLPRL